MDIMVPKSIENEASDLSHLFLEWTNLFSIYLFFKRHQWREVSREYVFEKEASITSRNLWADIKVVNKKINSYWQEIQRTQSWDFIFFVSVSSLSDENAFDENDLHNELQIFSAIVEYILTNDIYTDVKILRSFDFENNKIWDFKLPLVKFLEHVKEIIWEILINWKLKPKMQCINTDVVNKTSNEIERFPFAKQFRRDKTRQTTGWVKPQQKRRNAQKPTEISEKLWSMIQSGSLDDSFWSSWDKGKKRFWWRWFGRGKK